MFNGYKVKSSTDRRCYQHLKESNLGKNIGNVTNELYHRNKIWKFFPEHDIVIL